MVRLQRLKRLPNWDRSRARLGQGLVEFGIAGMVFFILVFGTLDIGRAVFQYSEIENAVREGGRVAKVKPCDDSAITTAVTSHGTGQGLVAGDVGITRSGCTPPGNVTVSATYRFTPIVGGLLGISPITTTVDTKVEIE
jgi:TadE-like protein